MNVLFYQNIAACAVGALLVISNPAAAANPVEQHNSNAVWFENWTGMSNATLKVTTPDGTIVTLEAASGTPVFQLTGSDVADGIYRYELTAATDESQEIINPQNNGRGENQATSMATPFYATGHFTVERGVIITPESIQEDASN